MRGSSPDCTIGVEKNINNMIKMCVVKCFFIINSIISLLWK